MVELIQYLSTAEPDDNDVITLLAESIVSNNICAESLVLNYLRDQNDFKQTSIHTLLKSIYWAECRRATSKLKDRFVTYTEFDASRRSEGIMDKYFLHHYIF